MAPSLSSIVTTRGIWEGPVNRFLLSFHQMSDWRPFTREAHVIAMPYKSHSEIAAQCLPLPESATGAVLLEDVELTWPPSLSWSNKPQ